MWCLTWPVNNVLGNFTSFWPDVCLYSDQKSAWLASNSIFGTPLIFPWVNVLTVLLHFYEGFVISRVGFFQEKKGIDNAIPSQYTAFLIGVYVHYHRHKPSHHPHRNFFFHFAFLHIWRTIWLTFVDLSCRRICKKMTKICDNRKKPCLPPTKASDR